MEDYYKLVGESDSCWYILHNSEPLTEVGASTASSRSVYLK